MWIHSSARACLINDPRVVGFDAIHVIAGIFERIVAVQHELRIDRSGFVDRNAAIVIVILISKLDCRPFGQLIVVLLSQVKVLFELQLE